MIFTLNFTLSLQLNPVCSMPASNAFHAESGVDLALFDDNFVLVVESVIQGQIITKDRVRVGLLQDIYTYVVVLVVDNPEVVSVGLRDGFGGGDLNTIE